MLLYKLGNISMCSIKPSALLQILQISVTDYLSREGQALL